MLDFLHNPMNAVLITVSLLGLLMAFPVQPLCQNDAPKTAADKGGAHKRQSKADTLPSPTAASENDDNAKSPRKNANEGDKKTPESHSNQVIWDRITNFALAIATLIIAIFAVVQALAAKKSANAAMQAANTAERALRTLERADVLLESVGVQYGWDESDGYVVVEFKNFGRSRANDAVFALLVEIGRLPDEQRKPVVLPPVIVGPGDTQRIISGVFKTFLSKDAFVNAMAGNDPPLTFTATAHYDDIFGTPHTTDCEGSFDPKRKAFHVTRQRAD